MVTTNSSWVLKVFALLYLMALIVASFTVHRELLYSLEDYKIFSFYAFQYWPIALMSLYILVKSWPFSCFPSQDVVLPFKWTVSRGGKARAMGVAFILFFVFMSVMPFLKYEREMLLKGIYLDLKEMESRSSFNSPLDEKLSESGNPFIN